MMTGPGDERAAAAAGRGHLRASHADREQMIDTLKAAFVQGRLAKDEFDARVGQTLVSRTYAELAAVTAGLPARPAPARPARAQPPRRQPRRQVSNAVRWGTSGFVTPAIIAAASVLASVRGEGGYAVMAFVTAFTYFMFWLSVGASMLWQWHCMCLPGAGMCVRCAHTAASHRAPASCTVRAGSPSLWERCRCEGYVPPGISPQTVDLRLLSAARW